MEGLDFFGSDNADSKVEAVQAALNAAGFKGRNGKALTTDGAMGPNTAFAITAFWASKGQSHAPVIDDDLLKALNVAGTSKGYQSPPTPGAAPPPPGAADLTTALPTDAEIAASKKKKLYYIAGIVTVSLCGIAYFGWR